MASEFGPSGLCSAPALDLALLLLLSLALGLLVTSHVALAALLVARRPRWRALLALVVPPLAPYWGWTEGLKIWSVLWLFSATLYAVGFAVARSG